MKTLKIFLKLMYSYIIQKKNPNDLPEDDEKVIIIYSIEKDHLEQEVATYNKSNNRFYVDEFQYIDTNAKFIAWYKTINYKRN